MGPAPFRPVHNRNADIVSNFLILCKRRVFAMIKSMMRPIANGMNHLAYHALRLGLAITFVWIGVLILRSPDSWAGYIQPWALKLLPWPAHEAMLITGALDCLLGILLLLNISTRLAAFVGAIHMAMILITSGVNDITVRDFGLLGALLALSVMPRHLPNEKSSFLSHQP